MEDESQAQADNKSNDKFDPQVSAPSIPSIAFIPTTEFEDEETAAEFLRGIKEFNAGEFFECHETLEQVWRKQTSAKREFTQGIIQAAVAYYHLERNNQLGAKKLFQRALPRLVKFGPICFNVDVLPLTETISETLSQLESSENAIGSVMPGPPTIKVTNS